MHSLVPLFYAVLVLNLALKLTNHLSLLLEHVLFSNFNLQVHLDQVLNDGLDGSVVQIVGTFEGESLVVRDEVSINTKGNFSEISFN